MSNLSGKQVLILREGSQQIKGKNALITNIEAIKAIAESIRTTLGPKGLNKMLVDTLGDVTVTGDGAKILEELGVENPAAKMIVDLSKTLHKKTGDGASSAVIFIGDLMARVQEMIEMDLSPTLIYEGFIHAINETKRVLDQISIDVDITDRNLLRKVAMTALNSKSIEDSKKEFADMIADAIEHILETRGDESYIDLDNIQIVKKEGEGLNNSQFIEGIIVDKEIVNPMMPKLVKNAKIALIDGALEIIKTDFSSEIQITSPEEIDAYLKKEESMLKALVDSLSNAGATAVFCQKGIDEMAQHYLAKDGIIAVRRIKQSDMKKIARASGAAIITHIKSITKNDLGEAQTISEQKIGQDNMIFIEGCIKAKSVTLLIRGGTELIVDDAERAIKNGLSVLKCLIETPKIVGGAGSVEIELRKRILTYGEKIGGKEQIAIEQFADSLEIIPKIIVENSGKDPLDIITSLRAQTNYGKKQYMGYDAYTGKIINTVDHGIIEPMSIKKQILSLATELAIIFIRIDDYIRSSGKK